MGRIRRAGYLFVTWIGDHRPRHVHVFRDGELVVKWNLERDVAMTGRANARLRAVIAELKREGAL